MKILLNVISARNIGGGFQVVYNFIIKTQEYTRADVEWYYAVSEKLDSCLPQEFKERAGDKNYFVFPNQPDYKHTFCRVTKEFRQLENEINPDVIFTPLAPGYFFFKHKEVMRFANAWSTNANKYAWSTVPFRQKIVMSLKNSLQRALLKRADYIITQTNTVKGGLHKVTGLPDNRILVVHNVLPAVLQSMDNTHIDEGGKWIEVAAIGGQMYHKNFDIIPDVLKSLDEDYGIKNVRFHTTLPEQTDVWQKLDGRLKDLGFSDNVVNYGNLKLAELADVYRHCSYSFLPSVLETFSASTIEAMYFDLKIVASNLSFNTEVLGDAALYYEPMNAKDAAGQIAKLVGDKKLHETLSQRMKTRLPLFTDFKQYFNDTLDFLVKVGSNQI